MDSLPADDPAWFEAVLGNQPPLWRMYADACRGQVIDQGGVQAVIIPESPNRSFFNSVFYRDATELIEQLPSLARAYEDAGVNAWTVWSPATDERAKGALSDAGHVLDAEPRAMGFELTALNVPEPDPDLEIREETDMEAVRSINETAYGYAPGDFPPIDPLPDTRVYLADLEGQTVGTATFWETGLDSEVTFVATLPEARGRGIAKHLMAHALSAARERGQRASTLIATKLGFPVYDGLGYRDVGGLEMWERRDG